MLRTQNRFLFLALPYNFTEWRKSSPFLGSLLQLTMMAAHFRKAGRLAITLKSQMSIL